MPNFSSSVKVCLRSGSLKLLLYMGFASLALAVMVSAFSGRQLATMMIDFGFSSSRIVICLAALLWVQELIVRPIESKTITQALSFPASRWSFVLSTYTAVIFMVCVAVAVISIFLAIFSIQLVSYVQATPVAYGVPYAVVWFFMALDLAIVIAFALLVAVVSSTPYLAVVVALGFYVAGHAIGQMVNLLSIATYIDGREFFQVALKVIQFIIPDLSAFDVREWAIYAEDFTSSIVLEKLLAGLAYLGLCLSLACYSFGRREIK